jgi:hypothetical protein
MYLFAGFKNAQKKFRIFPQANIISLKKDKKSSNDNKLLVIIYYHRCFSYLFS